VSEPSRVHVVVLNYRNYSDTIECVRALLRVDYPEFEIVLVDNGSDNESESALRREFPELELIQTGKNLGYSGGNNAGIRRAVEAGAEFVVILNNDTLVQPDFLTALVEHARKEPSAGILGALVLNPDGSVNRTCARRIPPLGEIGWNHGPGRWFGLHRGWRRASEYEDVDSFDRPREVEIVSGACLMLRRSTIDRIGYLDDRSFLFWEEFILAEKLKETGLKTFLVPASRVEHLGGGAMKTIRIRHAFYFLQSLNLYLAKYRGVGFIRRCFVMAGPALFFVPGILKTITGLRRLRS
jgi:GT2 family glycosyltransferase